MGKRAAGTAGGAGDEGVGQGRDWSVELRECRFVFPVLEGGAVGFVKTVTCG